MSVSLHIRTLVILDEGPFLWPHLTFITSLKSLYVNTIALEDRASIYEFLGHNSIPKDLSVYYSIPLDYLFM